MRAVPRDSTLVAMPHADDVPAGFTIVKPIGSGGSGRVYLATQAPLGRLVALKLYSQDLTDENECDAFRRECAAARRVGSMPGVVTVYDAGVAGRRPWMAMEHYPQGSLADLLSRDGAMPPDVALTMAVELADGLRHLHAHGLFHGDIKPGNVLVGGDGRPVLTDFGLSAVRQARASMTADAFSPPYAAPEHLLENRYSAASEVWGFGAVVYEMLAGRPPFLLERGESLVTFANRVATQPLDTSLLDGAPAPLGALVRGALAKARHERPTIEELATSLAELRATLGWSTARPVLPPVADDETRSATTVNRPHRTVPKAAAVPNRPRRTKRLLAVAGAILVLAALGLWAYGGQAPHRVAATAASRGDAHDVRATRTPVATASTAPVRPAPTEASPAPVPDTAPPTGVPQTGGTRTVAPTAVIPTGGSTPAGNVAPVARPLQFGAFGTGLSYSGNLTDGLTLRTPTNDYSDLRGILVQTQACDARLDLDARIDSPGVDSPGYGLGVAPHGAVSGGDPQGWSMQFEWDGARGGFYHRAVELPDQAGQATSTTPVGISADTWFHLQVVTQNGSAQIFLDGVLLDGAAYTTGDRCGAPLLRVWGNVVEIRHLTVG
jgi:hypothetical protein